MAKYYSIDLVSQSIFRFLLLFSHQIMSSSFATPWTVIHQAPLSMGFPKQECQSGLSFPSPGDLPDPRDQTCVSCIAGEFFTTEPPRKPLNLHMGNFLFFHSTVSMEQILLPLRSHTLNT